MVVAVVAAISLGACGTKSTQQQQESAALAPPAPFTNPTPVPGRVHNRNDGTSFEPCTAMTTDALTTLGLDPRTWTDVSMSDGGPRGCRATSRTSTFSVLVLNAAANETYLTGVAEVDDPAANTYRFTRSTTCVAAKNSGKATVFVSFSDDTQRLRNGTPNVATEHGLCTKAVRVLDSLKDSIPVAITEKVGMRSTLSSALMYTYLIQAGSLQRTAAASRPNRRVVDDARRIYPASALDLQVIVELGTPLWKS